MRVFAKTRTVLTFVVALVAAMELLHWVQPFAVEERLSEAPWLVVGADGEAWFRRMELRSVPASSRLVRFALDYDEEGRLLRERPAVASEEIIATPSLASQWRRWTPATQFGGQVAGRFRRTNPSHGWSGPDSLNYVIADLYSEQARAWTDSRGWSRRALKDGHLQWKYEGGRFACIDLRSHSIVASFGPDGWSEGPIRPDAVRFSGEAAIVALRGAGRWDWALVDATRREIDFIGFDNLTELEPEKPLHVRVSAVPVAGSGGEAPQAVTGLSDELSVFGRQSADADDLAVAFVRAGNDLVSVRADGVIHRTEFEFDEAEFGCVLQPQSDESRFHDYVGTAILKPLDPARPHVRIYRCAEDGAFAVRDLRTPLVVGVSAAGEVFGGLLTLFRPPVLTTASFVLPGPSTLNDYGTRRLLDPDVAGGANVGWFVASLAVAALCGALARRQARLRAPAARDVLFWTVVGAALGVVGLLLMAVLLPKSHVVACACGRRRAVHVETCPTCAARWPAPEPTGIEVFA